MVVTKIVIERIAVAELGFGEITVERIGRLVQRKDHVSFHPLAWGKLEPQKLASRQRPI